MHFGSKAHDGKEEFDKGKAFEGHRIYIATQVSLTESRGNQNHYQIELGLCELQSN